jgi:hypothetical protein
MAKSIPKQVARCEAKRQQASEALMTAVKRAYPVGARIVWHASRGDIHGVVTGHQWAWWHQPGEVFIDNGKPRHFSATSERVTVLAMPSKAAGEKE